MKKYKPESSVTDLSGTQPTLEVLAFWGGIWACAPVSQQPEIVLTDWHVFELQLPGRMQRTRHFAGQNITDREGRASSAIMTFDPKTGRGITESGRVYQLQGRTGFSSDGEYTWNRWKSINAATEIVDVTVEIKLDFLS